MLLIRTGQTVGPHFDHTLGSPRGSYLEYDSADHTGPTMMTFDTTKRITSPFDYSGCLSLWYYVDTESKFNLTMGNYEEFDEDFRMYVPLDLVTGKTISRTWRHTQTTINNIYNTTLSIQLSIDSQSRTSAIAIDDIKLTLGACKYTQGGECTFSDGFCGYQVSWTLTGEDKGRKGQV